MPPQHYGHPGYPPPAGHHPGFGYAPGPGHAPPPQYEFTPAQNEILDKLAGAARGLGILQYISAALSLLGANIVGAGISFVIGYQFHQGGTAMQRVVDTTGNDIGHLMEALDKLSGVFMIRLVLALVAAVTFVLIGVLSGSIVIAALAEASRNGHF